MGPSGAGKSSTIRDALATEGSGVVLTAPGNEEFNSYTEFAKRDGYAIMGAGDPEFLPVINMRNATGFSYALKLLNGLYVQARYHLGMLTPEQMEPFAERWGEPTGELKYQVLGIDTLSGVGTLAVNHMLMKTNLDDAPPAQSPEGAHFYGGIKNIMEHFMAAVDGLRGYGMDLIATSHVMEREQKKTAMAEQVSSKAWVPAMTGSFRESVGGKFDLVMYSQVDPTAELINGKNNPGNPRHYVQWLSDPKKPTKSRVGALANQEKLPNEWSILKPLYDAALEARKHD